MERHTYKRLFQLLIGSVTLTDQRNVVESNGGEKIVGNLGGWVRSKK